MKRIRSAKINGHRWKVQWGDCDGDFGECDYANHTITINPETDPVAMADTAIHEYIHARFPDLSERCVEQVGTEISDMLDRIGLISEDE